MVLLWLKITARRHFCGSEAATSIKAICIRPSQPLQVNGVSVVGMQHAEVVAAIKVGGDMTKLLVVDEEADEFFKRCHVLPTEEHLTGMTLFLE